MLNARVVSLSLAVTTEVIYLSCAVLSYVSPKGVIWFFSTWIHALDLTAIVSSKPFAAADFFTGFVSIFIASYLTGMVFTYVYNAAGRAG
ncbi:MAG: hypothetical protein HY890_05785 [Deltaproteobacteria bacterium]|nr:hypothetical protein [Deltaproteobacteria bacterium]